MELEIANPNPQAVDSLGFADRKVVEAVRENTNTHEGIYLNQSAAKRILKIIDAVYPNPE